MLAWPATPGRSGTCRRACHASEAQQFIVYQGAVAAQALPLVAIGVLAAPHGINERHILLQHGGERAPHIHRPSPHQAADDHQEEHRCQVVIASALRKRLTAILQIRWRSSR
jgi:hypothetical protein